MHILVFIANALLGKLSTYIYKLVSYYTCNYRTRSSSKLFLNEHRAYSEFGKTVFSSCAPRLWN